MIAQMRNTIIQRSLWAILLSLFTLTGYSRSSVPEKDYVAYLFTYFTGNRIS